MATSASDGSGEKLTITLATMMPLGDQQYGLGLRVLKSYLLHHGPAAALNVLLKTLPLSLAPEAAAAQILREKPRVVGFSAFAQNTNQIIAASRKIREMAADPPLLVGGGPGFDHDPDGCLAQSGLDIVVVGEGEEVFRRLVETVLAGSREFGHVPNLRIKCGAEIVRTERDPARSEEDLSAHDFPLIIEGSHWNFFYETSRGCIFRCPIVVSCAPPSTDCNPTGPRL